VRTKLAALALALAVLAAGVGAWAIVRNGHGDEPAVERAVERARDAHPLLLPTNIPVGWTAETEVSRSFFRVRYTAPGGQPWFEVAIAVANPPLPDDRASTKTVRFRDDDDAHYEERDGVQTLRWTEPGSWTSHVGAQPDDQVPYEMTADGLSEARFFRMAESLEEVA
jgi:hypothetical protein